MTDIAIRRPERRKMTSSAVSMRLLLVCCLAAVVCAQPTPPASCVAAGLTCGPQTFACVGGRCFCQPRFFGLDCTQHFFTARPDLFYGIYGATLPLYYILAVSVF